PDDPIFDGAYESLTCAVFIPDSTGGGTCIEEKPAETPAPAQDRRPDAAEGCAVFIPDSTGGGTCADPDVVGDGGGILPPVIRSGEALLNGDDEEPSECVEVSEEDQEEGSAPAEC
ncbi:MAG: hypothetical protein AAGL49_10945, partial [Pseudomonadota bacterium]